MRGLRPSHHSRRRLGAAAEAPIAYAEWIEYARSDARLVEAGTISYRDAEPEHQAVYAIADGPSIHWRRGQLVVSGAEESDAAALHPIAEALHARVQGDDGEFYD